MMTMTGNFESTENTIQINMGIKNRRNESDSQRNVNDKRASWQSEKQQEQTNSQIVEFSEKAKMLKNKQTKYGETNNVCALLESLQQCVLFLQEIPKEGKKWYTQRRMKAFDEARCQGPLIFKFWNYKGQLIIIWSIKMQFYSYSTQEKGEQEKNSQAPPLAQSPEQKQKTEQQTVCNSNLYYFNHYCKDLLEVSSIVNLELIKNNQLLQIRSKLLQPKPENQQKQSATTDSSQGRSSKENSDDNGIASRKNNSKPNDKQFCESVNQNKRERRSKKKKLQSSSADEYEPDEDQYCLEEPAFLRSSQSKNIPENYSKAIFNFIRKNEQLTDKVLRLTGTDRQEFRQSLDTMKKKLGTIAQLQWLWSDSKNRFAKAYRILSMEYLRKHSLPYIFNSRVNIYGKHIKYRYRIIESVKDPQNFTHMKEF